MANRKLLLCLLSINLFVFVVECRFGGRSSSRSSSRSSYSGRSSGSSHHSYPSSYSGLSGSSSRTHSYPSSSSGLSGSSSGSYSNHNYPSSSSGLSGSSTYNRPSATSGSYGNHYYPSSSSGLSGSSTYNRPSTTSGSGYHSYPSSSSGLSGSSSYNQPATYSGLWNFGSNSPSSSFELSGSGNHRSSYNIPELPAGVDYLNSFARSSGSSKPKPPTSYSKPSLPTYTSSNDYKSTYHPSHSYNTNTGYKPGLNNNWHGTQSVHLPPTYYTSPQYVYVNQYRNSDSRYGDLLTGLALYNMGRSHNHYHEHYYYDDYYSRRSYEPNNNFKPDSRVTEKATCTLKITENGKQNILRIPCEIVSTFTNDGEPMKPVNMINSTVCTTNSTIIKTNIPVNVSTVNTTLISSVNRSLVNSSVVPKANEAVAVISNTSLYLPVTEIPLVNSTARPVVNSTTHLVSSILNSTIPQSLNITVTATTPSMFNDSSTVSMINDTKKLRDAVNNATIIPALNSVVNPATVFPEQPIDKIVGEKTNSTPTLTMQNVTVVNVTVCTSTTNIKDPLSVKGPRLNPSNIECAVEIRTKDSYLSKKIDCNTLMKYAKMPEPKKESTGLLPSKQKLKSWLSNPPWWMSTFITV